jgi:hypothetical protein
MRCCAQGARRFREYEMGHEIRPEALREIIGWLEQKVLSPVRAAYGRVPLPIGV